MLTLSGEIKNCKFCGEEIRKDLGGGWYTFHFSDEKIRPWSWRCSSEKATLTVLGRVHLPVGER